MLQFRPHTTVAFGSAGDDMHIFSMSLMHLAVRSEDSLVVPRSLPYTADATGSKMSKNCSADRSHDFVVVLSFFLLSLTPKIAAMSISVIF